MESQQWRGGEFNPIYGAAAGTTEPATRWPSPEEQRQDLHWTAHTPRPQAGDCADFLLAGRQEQWDEGEAQRQKHEAAVAEMRAERESADEKAKAERDAEFAAREARLAAVQEGLLRARYLSSGGTLEGWERDRDRVLSNDAMKRMESYQGGALISPAEMLR